MTTTAPTAAPASDTEEVQDAVRARKITPGHARALLPLADADQQLGAYRRVVAEGLSVRQTEAWVRRRVEGSEPGRAAKARRRPADPAAESERLEREFQEALGTRVELARAGKGGRLVIHFYSEEELQALYDRVVLGVLPGAEDPEGIPGRRP